jgi:hypothetical protein
MECGTRDIIPQVQENSNHLSHDELDERRGIWYRKIEQKPGLGDERAPALRQRGDACALLFGRVNYIPHR